MCDNYDEFCQSAESAKKNGTSFKFFRYRKHLRYDSDGVYSYNSKIAHVDLKQKTIQKVGPLTPLYNNHYVYAAHMFKICYDFHEVLNPCELIHIQHLSYDDHT